MPARSIGELFNDALEQQPENRDAFLREACGNDEELYTRISSLLALHDQLGSFMKEPIVEQIRAGQGEAAGPLTVTRKIPDDRFSPGQLLGDRYRIESLLGRGGMGEVWRAYDLKLHVDVALKRLHRDLFSTERGLEMLRHEVRSARNVMSPHVCRIFDLVAEDGQELVSMEYIDGHTLQDLLKEKAPLELREAGEIAAQLLAGLEAIHEADLVHRDVKPANVMITRAGRVVLMDFGLAKGLTDANRGSIAGTPAYMAPEQARGGALDARADIFAAGVILAEMLTPGDQPSREALWAGVRETPAKVPEGPWADVLRRAAAWDPNGRYATAREMARALEEVTLRAAGVEERSPYPGLNPFTENDAEYFFGREAEVEAVWKKLQRSSLLAVIGLSGVGKSSFLRAGLVPAAPPGWRCVVCTPGASPFKALGQTMVPEMSGDTEAMGQLFDLEEPGVALNIFSQWRRRHGETLLVLDQFEELFTLNRTKVQSRFTKLLSQLAMEADVHVLISMRDDFLFQCQEHPALHPVLTDLTLMGTLSGSALRRALVQPALACGYRYEDDSLVDEMIEEIREERGALPLLAFAAASMWEHRDRTTGTLTRRAYQRIGGVGGALARHAEATMERIGVPRHPVVREIFRNLSTARGTRAVRVTEEILTLFENREEAQVVLRQLIEARLLTSFDAPGSDNGDDDVGQRVEIIHESLLNAWPRLVRWRTQDAEGAQLHDQLRQAAQLWQERSQSDDLLWTGTAFREFELWRERYEGALTESERAFAEAMERRDRRRRRVKRTAIVAAFAVLLIVLGVVGSLWRTAQNRALRTEALRFLEIGKDTLEDDNSRALAFAIASLERVDSPDARSLVMKSLWKGPTRFELPETVTGLKRYFGPEVSFSPDGKWLAAGSKLHHTADPERRRDIGIHLIPADGGLARRLDMPAPKNMVRKTLFSPSGRWLLTWTSQLDQSYTRIDVFSTDPMQHVRMWEESKTWVHRFSPDERRFLTEIEDETNPYGHRFEWWDIEGGRRISLGIPEGAGNGSGTEVFNTSADGRWLAYWIGHDVYVCAIDSTSFGPGQWVGRYDEAVRGVAIDATGDLVGAVGLETWNSIVWSRHRPGEPLFQLHRPLLIDASGAFDHQARWIHALDPWGKWFRVIHDLRGPMGALPQRLDITAWGGTPLRYAYAPSQPWLVGMAIGGDTFIENLHFYPMRALLSYKIDFSKDERGDGMDLRAGMLSPDGQALASVGEGLWLTDLSSPQLERRLLMETPEKGSISGTWKYDLSGKRLIVPTTASGAWVAPLNGDGAWRLEGSHESTHAVAFSPSGNRMATGGGAMMGPHSIKVWTAEGELICDLEGDEKYRVLDLEFLTESQLVVARIGERGIKGAGLSIWDVESRESTLLAEGIHGNYGVVGVTVSENYILTYGPDAVSIYERATFTKRDHPIPYDRPRGQHVNSVAIAPDESFVAVGSSRRLLYLYFLEDELLHTLPFVADGSPLQHIWISPDARWIATTDRGSTLRYWPVPRGRSLEDRPLRELLDVARAQTNYRVVVDPDEAEGYSITTSEFPGWETVPNWQDWYSEEYFENPPWRSYRDILEESER